MDARQLVRRTPVVRPADALAPALAAMLAADLPGLVVRLDREFLVIPASQALRAVLPRYVLDDAALGRVWDEASADVLMQRLAGKQVADLVAAIDRDRDPDGPDHVVEADATVVELAAVMAAAHLPLVAVVEDGRLLGVVTVDDLLGRLLA